MFLMLRPSSMFFPLSHSVATELDAIAEPQPKVLNFVSVMLPSASTLICSFITSPHAGAPTSPWRAAGAVKRKRGSGDAAGAAGVNADRANCGVALVERAHVPRILVVVDDVLVVAPRADDPHRGPLQGPPQPQHRASCSHKEFASWPPPAHQADGARARD